MTMSNRFPRKEARLPGETERVVTEQTRKTSLRRVAVASFIGTTIEWYDFFVYSLAAAFVFPAVFFPELSEMAGTVASFAVFAVAFVARPIGAVLFGHFGDRVGRKKTLVATLLLMGCSTTLIGVLPGAGTIGVAAPIILVVLRFTQGLAVGGEWAGAVLLTAEYAPAGKRGLYTMFPQLGPAIAYALANSTFLVTELTIGEKNTAFIEYGWRVPFIVSVLLVVIGLYIRLEIEETPVFRAEQERTSASAVTRTPFADVLRNQRKEVLLAAGILVVMFALFYTGTTYLASYGASKSGAGLGRPVVLLVGVLAAVSFGATTVLSAIYSDRLGRRRVIMACCVAAAVWLLMLFPLVETRSTTAYVIGVAVTLAIFGVGFGPVGALLPELFHTRYRYTGASVGYNLAGIVGGALPPIIAGPIAAAYGGIAVGAILSALAVVSFLSIRAVAETKDRTLIGLEPHVA